LKRKYQQSPIGKKTMIDDLEPNEG
jgi:hypothetical protein